MLDIIGKKNWYFFFSLVLIVPGLISLLVYGLHLSVEFTGGSRMALHYAQNVSQKKVDEVRDVFTKNSVEVASLQSSGKELLVRTAPIDEKQNKKIVTELQAKDKSIKQESFESIGPTIGREVTWNAVKAVAISSLLILLYIAWQFRVVPKPASSWRFGVTAIITLIHDVLVLIGLFSIFGHFFKVEIDSLFITALLTVMGFSVHDTIVVFDRIRENLQRTSGTSFAKTVNDSILQTMVRSLNTSFTALLVLLALLLFGGETIRWFGIALFIGIASGTYSSIFNAAPLLVLWDELTQKNKKAK